MRNNVALRTIALSMGAAALIAALFIALELVSAEKALAVPNGRVGEPEYGVRTKTGRVYYRLGEHKLSISRKKNKGYKVILRSKKKKRVYNGDLYFYNNRAYYSYTRVYKGKYKRYLIYSMSLNGKNKRLVCRTKKTKLYWRSLELITGRSAVMMCGYDRPVSIDLRSGRITKLPRHAVSIDPSGG